MIFSASSFPRRNDREAGAVGVIAWILFGLVAGVIAKLIMPGRDPGGFIVTILIGIAGAFVGGFVGTQAGFGDISGFDLRSMALAVAGAVLLLIGYRFLKQKG
jgi:uncharacterized membrane protein YeaQ/YmgE (transglycosylase-associated protein family)